MNVQSANPRIQLGLVSSGELRVLIRLLERTPATMILLAALDLDGTGCLTARDAVEWQL